MLKIATEITMIKLFELGFRKIGFWRKRDGNTLSFELSEFHNVKDTVFAFVENSTIVYMNSSSIELETTLHAFIEPSELDVENEKIKQTLLKGLNSCDVTIYALKNRKFFGLLRRYSDAGIKELICKLKPIWNSENLKCRMKNIVGRDRSALIDSEKIRQAEEAAKKIAQKKENTKKQETYIFPLGKSYYERGFFNLKTAYSHLVGEDKDEIQIILVGENQEKETIRGRVNRTANSSKTARIIGNKPLKVWFEENTKINTELRITFISKKKIKIEIA